MPLPLIVTGLFIFSPVVGGLFLSSQARAEVLCAPYLVQGPSAETQAFTAYLGQLLEEKVLSAADLAQFVQALENQQRIINPLNLKENPHALDFLSTAQQIHYEALQDYLDFHNLIFDQVLEWGRKQSHSLANLHEVQANVRVLTQDLVVNMVFHKIQPGKFTGRKVDPPMEVVLAESFEMMSTLVTQRHWALIMGTNPAKFVDGPESIELQIAGKKVLVRPDHPVENVNWQNVQAFIRTINKLSKAGDHRLFELIPDHRPGDQFRLPTNWEWVFVITDRGRASSRFYFGDDSNLLSSHAWFSDNSNGSTQSVGLLRPLVVDGLDFYDLYGNVREWTQSEHFRRIRYETRPRNGLYRYLHGGYWNSPKDVMASPYGHRLNKNLEPSVEFGFRLVRIRN